METPSELLAPDPEAVLHAILDAVVDGYAPVVAGVQNDLDEIETKAFDRDSGRLELDPDIVAFSTQPDP